MNVDANYSAIQDRRIERLTAEQADLRARLAAVEEQRAELLAISRSMLERIEQMSRGWWKR